MKRFEDLPLQIQKFSSVISSHISSGKTCRECPLFGKGSVILDTNVQRLTPVHLSILGLNPGTKELEAGIPFVGGAGKILHKYLDPIIEKYELSYVIYNAILCHTPNEKSIPDFKKVSKYCRPIVETISQGFPSKSIE